MKRVIFITDIHGYYTKFTDLLKSVDYDESVDTLILGGDYFDRGNENHLVAEWLIKNYKKDNVHLIRGNHDDFMIDLFNGCHIMYEANYRRNGLNKTIKNLVYPSEVYDPYRATQLIVAKYPELPCVFHSLVNYVEIDGNIYTHGGLPVNFRDNTDESDWSAARWGNSMEFAYENNYKENIFIGHWDIFNIHQEFIIDRPVTIRNTTFCDAGLYYSDTKGIAHITNIEEE